MQKHLLVRLSTVWILAACGSRGLAAENDRPSPGARDDHADAIEEVIVTARKRSESIQTVPMSITALTAGALEQTAVRSFIDYGAKIPNLAFGYTGDGIGTGRTISIRGVSGNGTTGFYIDETPLEDSIDPRIVDVERIEVLRGPQGTLYGARSEGGTVRLITRQPKLDNSERRIHVAISDTSHATRPNTSVDIALNIPLINDVAALRIVGLYDYEAGYFKRGFCSSAATAALSCFPASDAPTLTTSVDNVARTKTQAISAALLLKPSDNLTITPRLLHQRSDYNGLPAADLFAGGGPAGYPTGPIANPVGLPELTPSSFSQRRFFNVPEGGHDAWSLLTVNVKYELPFGEVTSATSYFDRAVGEREDQTDYLYATLLSNFGSAPIASSIGEEKSYARLVQEVRFTSNFSGPWQLVGGLFYSRLHGAVPFASRFPAAIVPGLDAAVAIPLGANNPAVADEFIALSYHTRLSEPAAYGELSYKWNEKWKSTVGLRWYQVKTTAGGWQEGFAVGGARINDPDTTSTESGVSPKLGIDYRVTPQTMVYATIAKGFRPGGIVASVPASPALGCEQSLQQIGVTPEATRHFKSDSLYNYELGAKTQWLDNRLTVNVAGFHIKWTDLQQQVLLSCGFGYTANAGAARSNGFELETHLRPAPNIELAAGVGYQDARITQSSSSGAISPQRPGDRVYMVPDWTSSASATHTLNLPNDWQLVSTVDLSYVSRRESGNNTPLTPRVLPSYHLLDARLALPHGAYEIAIVGKNLTNEHANLADSRSIAAEVPGRPRILTNPPRTIGLEFRTTF